MKNLTICLVFDQKKPKKSFCLVFLFSLACFLSLLLLSVGSVNSHNKSLSTYDPKNPGKTDEATVCSTVTLLDSFEAENAHGLLLGEACKKNHDATSLCPTLFSYYNWPIAISDVRTKEAEEQDHSVTRLLHVPADYSGAESHLIGYAFMLNLGIGSVYTIQNFSSHGMVPQLACSLLPICEVFGSPSVSSTLPSGEASNAVTLWRFNYPPIDVGDFPTASCQPMFFYSFPKLKIWYRQDHRCIASTLSGLTHGSPPVHQTVEALLMFRKENADGLLLGEACKKNHDATSLCPTLFSYYNWPIAISDVRTKEAEEQATYDYENAVRLNWNSSQYGLAEATLRTGDLVKAGFPQGKYIFVGVIDGRRHLENLDAEDCFFEYRMVVVLFRRELTFDQTPGQCSDQAATRTGICSSNLSVSSSHNNQEVMWAELTLVYGILSELEKPYEKISVVIVLCGASLIQDHSVTRLLHVPADYYSAESHLIGYAFMLNLGYRSWMCLFARTLCVIVSVITVAIGFYDLYKNVPVLKATASRLCGLLFDWVETWDMVVSKIKYLGTVLFLHKVQKDVKWAMTMARAVKTYEVSMWRTLWNDQTTGIDICSLAQAGGSSPATLPLPSPAFASLTITYSVDNPDAVELVLFMAIDLALIPMVGSLP